MALLTKKTDRFGILVWTLFAGLFVYVGIRKYGALLAYLKVSGYVSLFLVGFITYKLSKKLDEKIRSRPQLSYGTLKRLRFAKSFLMYVIFSSLCYILFFVQLDKLIIAHVIGIPREALSPCSNQPLNPEVERVAREIFRLKEIDMFDQNYCNSGE